MTKNVFALVLSLILLVLKHSSAQEKNYNASFIDTPPTIDGFLDEKVWKNKPDGKDFLQFFPTDSLQALQPTSFQVLYSKTTLYVAFKRDRISPGKR